MKDLSVITGLTRLSQKDYAGVHKDCIAAIEAGASSDVALFLLGVIAFDHKNYVKAAELFEKAETLNSAQIYYPAYLARTLSTLRRSNEAGRAADRASALGDMTAHLSDMLGVVYSRCGFHAKAIPHFEAATALNETEPNYVFNLAASRQFLGDFTAAQRAYERTLSLDPKNYRAWSSLISLNTQTPEHNYLERLEALLSEDELDSDAKLHLGHAKAKTLEDLGAFEESLEALLTAKSDKKAEFPFDRENAKALFEASKNTAQIKSGPAQFSQSVTPIFVVGLPRTGTTLVDRILSSHSRVTSAGELNAFAEQVKNLSGTQTPYVLDAPTLEATRRVDLAKAGEAYLETTQSLAGGAAMMVDKMPLNFFYAALMVKAFPDVKIIALRRGAMDSCLSNFRQLFSTQFSYYNYTYDLEDTAFFYREFDSLMSHWRAHLPADRFREVAYEDIVQDQENQTRGLLEFCGLDWEEQCLRFHENTAAVSTASSVQVRRPLYSGSIGRWKKYGDKLDGLKAALGDLAG